MNETGSHARARCMLRRNLPLWKAAAAITETLEFCRETGIGEIIWKVDAEAFNHGFTPLPLLRQFVPWLEQARDRSARAGVGFSINPWVTMNHAARARYPDGPPKGFHWRVRPNGETAAERACPLAPGWRQWLLAAYRLYAGTRPVTLWLEDDFKTFVDNAVELGCYCDRHLAAFGEECGEEMERAALVERLVRPGAPDPIRARWLEFQGRILVDVCRELGAAVHAVAPQTRLGLMQSWSTDGRWWAAALRALAGSQRPLARTSLAPYNETCALDFLPDGFDFYKESACLAVGTENCPELENSCYTPYSKSMRMTRLQMLVSQVCGNPGITMNLFDMVGSPTAEDPRVGRMLSRTRPFLDAIAGLGLGAAVRRGLSIPFPKRYADHVHLAAGQGFSGFRFDGEGWLTALQGSGLPVCLNGSGTVAALTGQTARSLAPDTIRALLSGAVLLDGSAAAVLCELGWGDWLGVRVGTALDRDRQLISAERDHLAADAEAEPVYIPFRGVSRAQDCQLLPLTPADAATVASRYVDNEHREGMPGLVLYENAAGGRVATCALNLGAGIAPGFMNWRRRRQLQQVACWLARDRIPLQVNGGAWMLPVRWDGPDCTVIAVLNFETDAWDSLELTFEWGPDPARTVLEQVASDGRFQAVTPVAWDRAGPNLTAHLALSVAPLDGVVLRVRPA